MKLSPDLLIAKQLIASQAKAYAGMVNHLDYLLAVVPTGKLERVWMRFCRWQYTRRRDELIIMLPPSEWSAILGQGAESESGIG